MKVLVIYTDKVEEVRDFLTGMGLEFVEEQHGSGPVHFACERDQFVLEVYPSKDGTDAVRFLKEK